MYVHSVFTFCTFQRLSREGNLKRYPPVGLKFSGAATFLIGTGLTKHLAVIVFDLEAFADGNRKRSRNNRNNHRGNNERKAWHAREHRERGRAC